MDVSRYRRNQGTPDYRGASLADPLTYRRMLAWRAPDDEPRDPEREQADDERPASTLGHEPGA